jgi:hypothetical protein
MKNLAIALFAVIGLVLLGCKSTHQEGIGSNMRKQWTDVMADTATTTNAAKAVLTDEGLKEVTATSTALDGVASGKMADGSKISVNVAKESDTKSSLSVVVGTMGSPTYGAELAKKIKMRAEAK